MFFSLIEILKIFYFQLKIKKTLFLKHFGKILFISIFKVVQQLIDEYNSATKTDYFSFSSNQVSYFLICLNIQKASKQKINLFKGFKFSSND